MKITPTTGVIVTREAEDRHGPHGHLPTRGAGLRTHCCTLTPDLTPEVVAEGPALG